MKTQVLHLVSTDTMVRRYFYHQWEVKVPAPSLVNSDTILVRKLACFTTIWQRQKSTSSTHPLLSLSGVWSQFFFLFFWASVGIEYFLIKSFLSYQSSLFLLFLFYYFTFWARKKYFSKRPFLHRYSTVPLFHK